MAHDPQAASARATGRAPLYGSWAIFFLVFTPHLAAAAAAFAYYTGGPRALPTQNDMAAVGGWAALWSFPCLVLLITVAVLCMRLNRLWYIDLGREDLRLWSSPMVKLGLVLSGWGALIACAGAALQEPRGFGALVAALGPRGILGCAEGLGLVGLGVGLAVGLILTLWGLRADLVTPPSRERDEAAGDLAAML